MDKKLTDYEQDYLKEQNLLDKVEDYLIDEIKVDRDLLECMISFYGRDFKVLRCIYEYETNNEDFNEIVDRLRNED